MSEQEVIVNKYERLAPIAITHAGGVVDVSGAMTALSIKEDIFTKAVSDIIRANNYKRNNCC